MEYVPYKRQLARVHLEKEIQAVVEEKIKALPNFNEFRLNNEVILIACNCVENAVKKKDKIQKKELVLKILGGVFNYNPTDKKAVEDAIEYLYLNGKIKKIKLVKHLFRFFKGWFQKKFL